MTEVFDTCQQCGEPFPEGALGVKCNRCLGLPTTERSDRAPYQARVIAEKEELDDKLGKLVVFLGGEVVKSLPDDELHRLRRQAGVMREYSDILHQRIQAWGCRA